MSTAASTGRMKYGSGCPRWGTQRKAAFPLNSYTRNMEMKPNSSGSWTSSGRQPMNGFTLCFFHSSIVARLSCSGSFLYFFWSSFCSTCSACILTLDRVPATVSGNTISLSSKVINRIPIPWFPVIRNRKSSRSRRLATSHVHAAKIPPLSVPSCPAHGLCRRPTEPGRTRRG